MAFKIDMHIHSVLGGDSQIRPDELVFHARAKGLDAVCVTEHHSFALSEPFDRVSGATGFPIFRGMEYKAKEGHLLVYGVNMGRGDMPPQLPMQEVIQWVQSRGGVAVPAHPYQEDMFGACLGDRLLGLKEVLCVETLNGSASPKENRKALSAAKRMHWARIGGSDAHGARGIGKAYTVFPHTIRSMADLVTALKSGDCRTALTDGTAGGTP